MSKTSEKNSDKQTNGSSSKLLTASVTDLYRKYRKDIFFSTRIQIVLFHTFFVAMMVLVIIALFDFAQKATLAAVAESLQNIISGGVPDESIITNTVALVETTKRYILGAIVALSILFGILAVQISLKPVRQSLALQKRFISSIAHELRTPLAILRVENEVAALESPPESPASLVLARNIEGIDRITEILNNLLLLHRVGALEDTTFEMVDLSTIMDTVRRRLQKLAASKGVALNVDLSAAPMVYGNRTALEQAIFNVAKNAILYTERGGEVRSYYHSVTDEHVTLAISDTGIGIAKHELPHIFEPFFRSRTDVAKPGGTGIGLAIVFDIVKLHRGKIHVNSRPGKGTDLYITLPRRAARATSDPFKGDGVTYDFSKPRF